MTSDSIDFIIVNYKTYPFINLLVKSIDRFVKGPKHIYIIDTSDEIALLKGISSSGITVESKKFISKDPNINNAVCNHMGGVNYAFSLGDSEYVCILDPDTIFIKEWDEYLIPKLNTYNFISSRFEPYLSIARPQFMLFKRRFWVENNLKFEYYKDTGGNITKFCQDNGKSFYILENSYNNKILKENHEYPEIYCEQCFIEGSSFFLHQGRGGSKGDRSTWLSVFSKIMELQC